MKIPVFPKDFFNDGDSVNNYNIDGINACIKKVAEAIVDNNGIECSIRVGDVMVWGSYDENDELEIFVTKGFHHHWGVFDVDNISEDD